jgi:hypothetical protein
VQVAAMVDEQRRRWLEALAAACERLLARRDDTPRRRDPQYVALLQDVAELLARLNAELGADRRG